MNSVILSKEHLLIIADFNIHVDVPNDPDALKFLDMIFNNKTCSLQGLRVNSTSGEAWPHGLLTRGP